MTEIFTRDVDSGMGRSPDGVVLALLRAYRHVSQKGLARRTGMHHVTISQYERGKRSPSAADRRRLLEGLELPERAWEAVAGVVEWLDWLAYWHEPVGPAGGDPQGEPSSGGASGGTGPSGTPAPRREADRLAEAAGRETQRWVRELLEFLIVLSP